MKTKYCKISLAMVLLSVIAAILMPTSSRASESDYYCDVTIDAEVRLDGANSLTRTTGDTRTVFLTAADNAPMPETSELSVDDAGTVTFGPIRYTTPGDYIYTLRQSGGSARYVSYDDSVYSVTVRVNNDDSGHLTALIWAVRNGGPDKTDKIIFANRYQPPAKPHRNPLTFDDAHPVIWIGIMLLMLLIIAFAEGRRKKE